MNLKPTLSQGRSLNSIKLLGREGRRLRVCKIKNEYLQPEREDREVQSQQPSQGEIPAKY